MSALRNFESSNLLEDSGLEPAKANIGAPGTAFGCERQSALTGVLLALQDKLNRARLIIILRRTWLDDVIEYRLLCEARPAHFLRRHF